MRLFSIVFSAVVALVMAGCNKSNKSNECKPLTTAEEDAKIQAYLTANNIDATKHTSGIYYQVINPGSGATPNINSTVETTYTGKYTNGNTFDSGTATFPLTGVIVGWQIGIPLVSEGGKIKLIIPPSLAYGPCDYRGIPGNSVLVFDVDLLDVK